MKLPFTIRDLFWAILVVALAIGWWLDIQSKNAVIEELAPFHKEAIELRSNLQSANERAARFQRLLPAPLAPKGNDDPFTGK